MAGCKGCGVDLPPSNSPIQLGRPRVWCSDKCRKDHTYKRYCVDCGIRVGSSAGHGPHAPKRCRRCSRAAQAEDQVVWTHEDIEIAIRTWAFNHGGEPPSARQWRTRGEDWPSSATVCERFGTWNEAIRSAGLTARSYPR